MASQEVTTSGSAVTVPEKMNQQGWGWEEYSFVVATQWYT